MCGIFGIHSNEKLNIEDNIMEHRGPDSWGVKHVSNRTGHITFFHSRLQVIGLGDQGHQPFEMDGFNSVLLYNGEIYNYELIRENLIENHNAKFYTNTDTEVLYQCIHFMGIKKTLEEINGMFSFAYFDENKNKIFLCRDHLGIKPLYYTKDDDFFSFASEIKVFFNHDIIKPILKRELLGEYLANGWIYEPDTLFKDIYKLKAANYLEYDIKTKKIETFEYWSFKKKSRKNDLDRIINSQIISDVPIGIYFSGGYDSSLIALSLMGKGLRHFNLNIGTQENKIVDYITETFKIDINRTMPGETPLNTYDKLLYHMDEPISDPAIIPAYELAMKAKSCGMTVMLSGMGGDEIDGGYTRHRVINNLSLFRMLPKFILDIYFRNNYRDKKRLESFLNDPSPINYFSITSYLNKKEINDLVGTSWQKNYFNKINSIVEGYNNKKKFYILDLKGFLASHNLIYMDKSSMAASVEVRVPLLDKDFVLEMISNIEQRNAMTPKNLIKKMFRNKIGKKFSIKKEGFSYPIHDFIKKDINWGKIIKLFEETNLINTQKMKNWLAESEKDLKLVDMKLWHLYTLYRWIKVFNVKIS